MPITCMPSNEEIRLITLEDWNKGQRHHQLDTRQTTAIETILVYAPGVLENLTIHAVATKAGEELIVSVYTDRCTGCFHIGAKGKVRVEEMHRESLAKAKKATKGQMDKWPALHGWT